MSSTTSSQADDSRAPIYLSSARMNILATSANGTSSESSNSSKSAVAADNNAPSDPLQALADTLAHTQQQAQQAEALMREKLLKKGLKITQSSAPAPAATESEERHQDESEAGSAPVTIRICEMCEDNDAAYACGYCKLEEGRCFYCIECDSEFHRPKKFAHHVRVGLPRDIKRVVEKLRIKAEKAEAEYLEKLGIDTLIIYTKPSRREGLTVRFNILLDHHHSEDDENRHSSARSTEYSPAVAAAKSQAEADELFPPPATSNSSSSAAFTSIDGLPAFVEVHPIRVSSFLHHRAPLAKPVVPTLEQLCCAALSQLAQTQPLPPVFTEDFAALPQQCLVTCIDLVKKPGLLQKRDPSPDGSSASSSSAALLMADPSIASTSFPLVDYDSPTNTAAAHRLQDFQLQPFLQPSLLAFTLEIDPSPYSPFASVDACGGREDESLSDSHESSFGAVVGLAENLCGSISSNLLDDLFTRSVNLQHLSLAGYTLAFSTSQIRAIASLQQLRSLSLAHCTVSSEEVQTMLRDMQQLNKLQLSWTSFICANSGGSSSGSGSSGGGSGSNDPFDDLVGILCSVPQLRRSLTCLLVDGARINPNELLCKLLELLPNIRSISMDSVAAPERRLTREEEEAEKRRLQESALGSSSSHICDEESKAAQEASDEVLMQLVEDNLKLKEIFQKNQSIRRDVNGTDADGGKNKMRAGYFPHLTSLSALASDKLSAETMLMLLPNAPHLTNLNVKGCQLLTNEVLECLGRSCPYLQHLNIADCQYLDSPALMQLVDSLTPDAIRQQREARLHNRFEIDEAEEKSALLAAALSSSKPSARPVHGSYLKSVDFSWCENFDNSALGSLFDLRASPPGSLDNTARQFLPARTGASSSATDFSLERVGLSCLESLDEETIRKLAKHRGMKELDVSRCLYITAKGILFAEGSSSSSTPLFTSLPSKSAWAELLRLNLSWTTVMDADIGLVVSQCPKLQHLNLEGCKHLRDGCVDYFVSSPYSLYNLTWISFFFVNHVRLKAMIRLIEHSTAYWIGVRDYYGDIHDPSTIEKDRIEASSDN